VNVSRYSAEEVKQLERQIEQIRRLSHPNIIKFRETYREKDHFIQIMEYVGGIRDP
jgi:serine/threonine protein kinase